MAPRRGRSSKIPNNGPDNSVEEILGDIISVGDSSDTSSVVIVGHGPASSRLSARNTGVAPLRARDPLANPVPRIFRDMLAESLPATSGPSTEAPRKRRKLHHENFQLSSSTQVESASTDDVVENDDDDEAFEDVLPSLSLQQTLDQSDDDSEEDEAEFEDVIHPQPKSVLNNNDKAKDLDLTLTTAIKSPSRPVRRKPKLYSKADRAIHLNAHKIHILCLLRHIDLRNEWCNDETVQGILNVLLTKKMRTLFKPNAEWSQFRQTESLKKGLEISGEMWNTIYKITTRGLRRPYWAEDEQDLVNFKSPPDSEAPLSKKDFLIAAKTHKGSRDIGAQLYCSLLRSAGLEARLVCSLQTLPLSASGKGTASMRARSLSPAAAFSSTEVSEDDDAIDIQSTASPFATLGGASGAPFSARRRLGHPHAAAYHMPQINDPTPPRRPKPKQKRRRIIESPFPVYWVEVLDEAHQKWLPVDPVVTNTVNKLRAYEPPASDEDNAMSYVMAFTSEGTARDVTLRYTRWYAAKTRKNRVEITEGGERWWHKVSRFYGSGWSTDLDEIENAELSALASREGMPSSIADFKNHPHYVLERDLKRNEVLIRRQEIGKIAAGRDTSLAGGKGKKLESVFRRSDVRAVKSADGWYRTGREVKVGEQPIKVRPPTKRHREIDDVVEESADVPLYMLSQTDIYEAPPVMDGRVPRNSFGNLDIYVPSMVPKGGVHIPDDDALWAARILGVDYACAVTGFEFRGRHGTAVIRGVIVAEEYKDAMDSVLEGLEIQRADDATMQRSKAAQARWRRFLSGLRIKERVDEYIVEGEEGNSISAADDDGVGMESEEYDDDGGGGFFPE